MKLLENSSWNKLWLFCHMKPVESIFIRLTRNVYEGEIKDRGGRRR